MLGGEETRGGFKSGQMVVKFEHRAYVASKVRSIDENQSMTALNRDASPSVLEALNASSS